jgi:signal recognition particle receptor subunit beta
VANHKVIFSGPTGSGKTTAIAAISDIAPFFTDEVATDTRPERSTIPGAALDYGTLKLDGGECLHLYGTPGLARFDFDWDSLAEDGLGLVIFIDNQRPDPIADLHFYLSVLAGFITRNAVAIGITRGTHENSPSIEDYHRVLLEQRLNIPVFEVDARKSGDVTMLLQALLYSLDPCAEH